MRRSHKILTLGPALALAVAAVPARAQSLIRRPYIQTVTPASVTLVWTTDVAASSRVRYGADPGSLTQTAQANAAVTQHEVRITGLTPGTRYYYDVGSTGNVLAGGDATYYFETAPQVGTAKKFRAWIAGDSGTGDARQAQVRDAMLAYAGRSRPHMFLHLGDMAYDTGATNEFTNNFFTPYAGVLRNTVIWPTLGNHEGAQSDSQTQTGPYYTAYVLPEAGEAGGLASGTEAYYSFDYANVHFVVLDSHDSPRSTNGAMLSWMRSDLSATNQPWIIAYWHHPPYTKGSHNSDTETQLIQMRENALPILEAAGVDLVLAGHSHIYERSFLLDGAYRTPTVAAGHLKDPGDGKPLGSGPYKKQQGNFGHDGAVYVVAGHGGAGVSGAANHPVMYFSEVDNGSCLLDIQDNRLSLVNIRWDGAVTDRFSMIKGMGIVVAEPDGGEALIKGDAFDIRWATVGSIPSVTLEYSTNDGASWQAIASSVANTGTYAWTVPDVDTAAALVRVSDATRAAVNDESNAGFAISGSAPLAAISFGDVWRYHDEGVDLGTAWLDLGYDDSSWAEGSGQFGYGDGDEATTTAQGSPSRPSQYFRKVIHLEAPVIAADVRVLHDDGVAVWVNGAEVFDRNVDNGTNYAAYASAASQDNELSTGAIALTPSPFVVGDNLVTAMVKQAAATSSDVSFDMALTVTLESPRGAGGAGGGGSDGSGPGGAGGTGDGGAGAGTGSSAVGAGGEEVSSGPSSGDSGGCGCAVAGAPGSSFGAASLGAMALLSRRRRRASPPPGAVRLRP